MWVIEVPLVNAQRVKEYLLKNNLFNRNYQPKREGDCIYFPLVKKKLPKKFKKSSIVQKKLVKSKKEFSVTELLKDKLTKKELSLLPSSFDAIGAIIILELKEGLLKKEKIIAKAYLNSIKSAKTVVRRSGIHSGVYRTRTVKFLAGKKTTKTIHRENGVRIIVDVEKMYFSNRLATERLRISKMIKKGEEILVMFSGSGVYPVVFAKNAHPKLIYGIEINPEAHKVAKENRVLNKLEKKIRLFKGDVRKVLPPIKKKFDRIAMPLPKTGEEFLPLALKKIKSGGIIHLYAFLEEKLIDKEAKKIKKICFDNNKKCRILKKVKCGQHAPRVFRVCFDSKIY